MNIKEKTQAELEQFFVNVRALRKKNRLSIKELAKSSKVSEYMIRNFEKGVLTERAHVCHVLKLCHFFGVKGHEIFSRQF